MQTYADSHSSGSGSLITGNAAALEAIEAGVYVVASTRSYAGASTPARNPSIIKSGFVKPIQARIQLQLAIASGYSYNQTFQLFEHLMRETIGQEVELE